MGTYTPRYEGDTIEQYLLDTECAQFEGDGSGMAKHLKAEHNVDPLYTSVGTEGVWTAVADQHVAAHIRELEGLDDPLGRGYRWSFDADYDSFAGHMAVAMISQSDSARFWEEFAGRRSPSQPDIMMRCFLNGVEVDAAGMLAHLEFNFDRCVADGVADKLRELQFDELGRLVSDMDERLAEECKNRMKAVGLEVPHEEDW